MELLIVLVVAGVLVGAVLAVGCFRYRKRASTICRKPDIQSPSEPEYSISVTSGSIHTLGHPGNPPGYLPRSQIPADWPASPPPYEAVVAGESRLELPKLSSPEMQANS